MKVAIETAKQMLREVYLAKGASGELVDWLTELSLEQDLTGNFFSGFEESPEGVYGNFDPSVLETYEVDKPALKLINGNGKPVKHIMMGLIPKATNWAIEQGQIAIGFKNCGYHGALGTIAKKFAEAGVVCMYAANGGPATVPPYGGTKELFGTNPIAYGIPTSGAPIVFDAATSERPFGSIERARMQNQQLQENTYFDKSGRFTIVPEEAAAILSFGGYKGSAINLLLDVLTGALVGAKSGMLVGGESDIGGYLLLIDPAAFCPLEAFKAQTDKLVRDIDANPTANKAREVRAPGQRAERLRARQLKEGLVEVDDRVWQRFAELHENADKEKRGIICTERLKRLSYT